MGELPTVHRVELSLLEPAYWVNLPSSATLTSVPPTTFLLQLGLILVPVISVLNLSTTAPPSMVWVVAPIVPWPLQAVLLLSQQISGALATELLVTLRRVLFHRLAACLDMQSSTMVPVCSVQ